MSPDPKNSKKPSQAANPADPQTEFDAPERVRMPHYDWEHEAQAESEAPRVKGAAPMSAWKENVEAWIKRYLMLADSSFGGRDDDPTPA